MGSSLFLINIKRTNEITTYIPETKAIFSIVKLLSIIKPNTAVPKAVENTIKAVVKAFIDPINFTPYISAQVDDPSTLANPFEIPTKPKKINAEISC